MSSWGYLRADTPFADVFPTGRVPLRSIVPMRPRDESAPLCYVVDPAGLTEAQIAQLAAGLYERWRPECASVAAAAAYIRDPGLPLRCAWFSGAATDDIRLLI